MGTNGEGEGGTRTYGQKGERRSSNVIHSENTHSRAIQSSNIVVTGKTSTTRCNHREWRAPRAARPTLKVIEFAKGDSRTSAFSRDRHSRSFSAFSNTAMLSSERLELGAIPRSAKLNIFLRFCR